MIIGIKKVNSFQLALGLTAMFVAAISAFFSVMGIGMLFSGAMISTMLMATSLECGKVVATSYLYRYWNKSSFILKMYLVTAIIVLMGITSLGVFGWLSSAHQSSAMKYESVQRQISAINEQKKNIESQIAASSKRLIDISSLRESQEKRMNDSLSNPALARNPTQLKQIQEQNISLIKQTSDEYIEEKKKNSQLYSNLTEMDASISKLVLDGKSVTDINTFKFVSDAIGWDLTTTVKWFIIVIISVFDPLAVCLILAYNVVVLDEESKQSSKTDESDSSTKSNLVQGSKIDVVFPSKIEMPGSSSQKSGSVDDPFTEFQKTASEKPQQPEKQESHPTPDTSKKTITTARVPGELREYEYFNSPTREIR